MYYRISERQIPMYNGKWGGIMQEVVKMEDREEVENYERENVSGKNKMTKKINSYLDSSY